MKKTKLLLVLGLVMMALFASACQMLTQIVEDSVEVAEPEIVVDDVESEIAEPTEEPLVETVEPEGVTLTVATVNNPDMKVMESLSYVFEETHPDINLEWVILPENELRSRLTIDIASETNSFDVVTVGTFEVPIWGTTGRIESVSMLANEYPDQVQPDYDFDDLIPAIRSGLSVDDNLYALPFYGESSFTFYNKAMFDEAGLEMPEQPTWDEIREFACALHKPEEAQYGIVLRGLPGWGEIMAPLTTVVNTHGGRWFDEEWMPQLNSPEWNKAVSFYVELVQDCGAPGAIGNGFTESLNLMSQGQAAIWVDATVAAGFLASSDEAENIGYALAPVGPVAKGNAWLWAWSLGVPVTSDAKPEALEFITWATSKEYIELVASENGWASVPPGTRISTYERAEYQEAAAFADLVLASILSADPTDATRDPVPYTGVQFAAIPEFQSIGTNASQFITSALAGNITVEEALDQAQAATLEVMEAAGYR